MNIDTLKGEIPTWKKMIATGVGVTALFLAGCSPEAQGKEPTIEPVHSAAPAKPGVENAENVVQQPVESPGASETASPTPEPTPSETASNVIEQEPELIIDSRKLVNEWPSMSPEERQVAADEFFQANAPDFDFHRSGMDSDAVEAMGEILFMKLSLTSRLNTAEGRGMAVAADNILTTFTLDTGDDTKYNPLRTLRENFSYNRMHRPPSPCDEACRDERGEFELVEPLAFSDGVFVGNLTSNGQEMTAFSFTGKTRHYRANPWNGTVTLTAQVVMIGGPAPGGAARIAGITFGNDSLILYNADEKPMTVSDAVARHQDQAAD